MTQKNPQTPFPAAPLPLILDPTLDPEKKPGRKKMNATDFYTRKMGKWNCFDNVMEKQRWEGGGVAKVALP